MRKLLTLLILVSTLISKANGQTNHYVINGIIANETPYTHAYLYFSGDEPLMIKRVVDKKFRFDVTTDKEFLLASFFLSVDSLTEEQAIAKVKAIDQVRSIVVENATITVVENAKTAIVEGTKYNAQLAEMFKVSNHEERLLFFTKYADSQISLLYLRVLLVTQKLKINQPLIDCPAYYALLTTRLKETREGVLMKARIFGN